MNLPFLVSPIGDDPVVMEADFSASAAQLFRAWTRAEQIKQWFGAGEGGPEIVTIDLQSGGEWVFTFAEKDGQTDTLSGEYLRIVENRLLEFSWIHTRTLSDGKEEKSGASNVTVEFEAHGSGTLLKLVHRSVASRDSRSNICGGWSASFNKIRKLVE